MSVLKRRIKWIMLVSGVVTATMFYGVVAPENALVSFFGEGFLTGGSSDLEQLQTLVVRSWSGLVGLMGVVLIVGFMKPLLRKPALILAASSKLLFVTLVFLYGGAYLENLAPAVAMDLIVVLVAVLYLSLPDQNSDPEFDG